MNSSGYMFGPPPNVLTIFPSRGVKSDDIISTQIPTELISKVLNESLSTGEVVLDEVGVDTLTGLNTTIQNIKVDTISKNTKDYIRLIDNIRMESSVLFGPNGTVFDSNYKVKILGNFMVSGTTVNLESDQVLIKDNCLGLGINNNGIDNFLNGYYFPKNDNFSSFGLSVDKIGLISLPLGSFESNQKFNFESSSSKRFDNNKNSFRFVYIDTNYDFSSSKTGDDTFSTNEMNYINSLNNKDNKISNYYVNVEINNLTCHGGSLISGISQDFNIILTNKNNVESTYITCSLDDNKIDMFKKINLNLTEHNISNNGTINFTTGGNEPKKTFSISNSENKTFRNLYFNNNGSGNSNIIFGGNDTSTQKTFSIFYNNISNPVLNIDSTTTSSNKIELKSRLVIEGPNTINYPNLKIINNMVGNKIGSTNPISNNYLQGLNISASTATNFILADILDTGYTDLIFTGQILLSDVANNRHLAMRLEGFYSTITANIVLTRTIISKKDINLTESNSTTDIMVDASVSGTTLIISTLNNLTSSLKGLLRLEIIQN